MADTNIILSTLNSRFSHTSLALRYIYANLNELQESSKIVEFSINDAIQSVAEKILIHKPSILGLSVYIWNATLTHELIEIIKKVAPTTTIILGGPEVSYEPFRVDYSKADYIIQGEGELEFYKLIKRLNSGEKIEPQVFKPVMANLSEVNFPYEFYSQSDVDNRYIYVEASRGCPFKCEFCLSSMDDKMRSFDLDILIKQFETLWERGVRNFKFIDRTFNINMRFANTILDFFLSKEPPYFAHFEVIPDHFPQSLKDKIALFPHGALQLEIGIQTLNPEIAENINRPLKIAKIKENIKFLENETSAHIHLDLIVGLPGESLESFAQNLDELCSISKSEIQIGILKKLSGTTIDRHDKTFGMIYSDIPPYDILKNSNLSFNDIQNMKRFARYWDLVYNSGNFIQTTKLLFKEGKVYENFSSFSQWIYIQSASTYKISLDRLSKFIFAYLSEEMEYKKELIGPIMIKDIMKLKGRIIPAYLKPYATNLELNEVKNSNAALKRQGNRS